MRASGCHFRTTSFASSSGGGSRQSMADSRAPGTRRPVRLRRCGAPSLGAVVPDASHTVVEVVLDGQIHWVEARGEAIGLIADHYAAQHDDSAQEGS